MLNLILAESELELVPKEIVNNPVIKSYAKQKGKQPQQIVLDSNYHHRAMFDIDDFKRRGRPDIVHIFLLTTLESIVNKKGCLRVFIHTRNNDVIAVNPETRIMRNYDRFLGLIEQLFEKNVVPDKEKPLLELKKETPLNKLVEELKSDYTIVFLEDGTLVNLNRYLTSLKKHNKNNLTFIIGGFPHGTFYSDVESIADEKISIYNETLVSWTVASEILVNYETVFL